MKQSFNMSRISTLSNRRANVRARRTKRRKSKSVTSRNHLTIWRRRALNNISAAERLTDLEQEKNEVSQERDQIRNCLTSSERELVRADRNYRALVARANKEKNSVVKIARERWLRKERDLKEQYEQRLTETEVECERQGEGRLEAEARVVELEDQVKELQGELDDMYESYY